MTTERHQVDFDSYTGNNEHADVDAGLAGLGVSTADSVMPLDLGFRPVTAYNLTSSQRSPALKQSPDTSNRIWLCMA